MSLGGGLRPPSEPLPNNGSRGQSPRSKRTQPSRELLHVRVQPRARRNEVVEQAGGVVRVRVTAAPEAGEANRAVIALLAEAFDVAPSRVELVRGATSRDKLVRIERRALTLPSPRRGEGGRG
jgi:uncharacterized protein (TIGR00251 family)